MKRRNYLSQFFIRIVMLWSLSFVVAAGWADEKKIGMMLPVTPTVSETDRSLTIPEGLSSDEKVAAQWFYDEYMSPTRYAEGSERGKFVGSDLSDVDVDVVWVMIDREGIVREQVASNFSTGKIDALKSFYKAGGNVLFTNAATQLIEDFGRVDKDFGPNEWNCSDYKNDDVSWYVTTGVGGRNDYKGHPLYCWSGSDNVYLIDGGPKRNPTCMWRFDFTSYEDTDKGENNLYKFQNRFHCNVIGVWGGETDCSHGAIIDFEKHSGYGHSIAIGLGAYEWATTDRTSENENNIYHSNIEKLTKNALRYLKMKATIPETPKIGFVVLVDGISKVPDSFNLSSLSENDPDRISDDEYMAYDWFVSTYGKGNVLTLTDIATKDINEFDVIWLHIDRDITPTSGETKISGTYENTLKGYILRACKT